MREIGAGLAGALILFFARFITAVRGRWDGVAPTDEQRIYFANHASHGDFVLIWTVLPRRMRFATRPVAGSDYWLKSGLRRFIGRDVFNAVLIDRDAATRTADPIVFPEGTRNTTDAALLPFKSGLYHLARVRPNVAFVPVWIDNLNRVMPKGEFVPVPLVCTVTFGAALTLAETERLCDEVGVLDRDVEERALARHLVVRDGGLVEVAHVVCQCHLFVRIFKINKIYIRESLWQ